MMNASTSVNENQFDLISIGECLVELRPHGTHPSAKVDAGEGTLDVGYAGDAFNALYYAARLGMRCGFVSAVGDDLFTPMLTGGMRQEMIDTSFVAVARGRRNGLYAIELDHNAEYTFHFWRSGSAATQTLDVHAFADLVAYVSRARYLLISGITLAVMEHTERLFALLNALPPTVQIVLDSNYRAALWSSPVAYRALFQRAAAHASILLPTLGDITAVYGSDAHGALAGFAANGLRMVVVKDGANGCARIAADGRPHWHAPHTVIHPVDTTGAGDAFNAGFIAALASGASADAACAAGNATAAQALVVRGALNPAFGRHDHIPHWHGKL